MKLRDKAQLDGKALIKAEGRKGATYQAKQVVFSQDDVADAIFYIQSGHVRISVVSNGGKEAVIAILGAGDFFGEGCLAGQARRVASTAAISECSIVRLGKDRAVIVLHEDEAFASLFLAYLLSRNIRIEEDLTDQLFNSSEKRLARVLLLMANFTKDGEDWAAIPKISQETLAEMVGTTRSRVSFFMNKFRKLGLVKYDSVLEVHRSLLSIICRSRPRVEVTSRTASRYPTTQ
jgi:CRP/FNR family transcriptional regulator, cyclic AMP receptor protein